MADGTGQTGGPVRRTKRAVQSGPGAGRAPRPVISEEDWVDQSRTNEHFRFATFRDCGFRQTEFTDGRFEHCRFERCYFKHAQFTRVVFLNCRFVDCGFGRAVFSECDLGYSEFQNCDIEAAQLRETLPQRLNIRSDLLRSLRMNAQARGLAEDVRWYLFQELRAAEEHHRRTMLGWFGDNPYYRKHYGPAERFRAFHDWWWLLVQRVLWGYGERWTRVLIDAVVVVAVFAVLYSLSGWDIRRATGARTSLGAVDAFFYSMATLVSAPYGDWVAYDFAARVATGVEGGIGLVLFGFLVAALYRRISVR